MATRFLLVIATLNRIRFGNTDIHTCCYSDECALPVFKQWSGTADPNEYFDFIDSTVCCPSVCLVGGDSQSGISSTNINGTLETACVCHCPQTCDTGINYSRDTCDGGQYMTDTGCPDAVVDDIDLIPNITAQEIDPNHIDYQCIYNIENGTRRMSQRCFASEICVSAKTTYDGDYTKESQHYNGFPQYYNGDYLMRIEERVGSVSGNLKAYWIFIANNGSEVGKLSTLYFRVGASDYGTMKRKIYEPPCTTSPTMTPTTPTTATPTSSPVAAPRICVDLGKEYDGTYYQDKYGDYINEKYSIKLDDIDDSVLLYWIVTMNNGTMVRRFSEKLFESEWDFSTYKYGNIYNGVCTSSPTESPTKPTSNPTLKPTSEPTEPTPTPTIKPTQSPITFRPTQTPVKTPTRNPLLPTERPTYYYESLFRPTSSPATRPSVIVVETKSSSNETVLIVVIIALVIVIVVLGAVFLKNKKQKQMTHYMNMNQTGNVVYLPPHVQRVQ